MANAIVTVTAFFLISCIYESVTRIYESVGCIYMKWAKHAVTVTIQLNVAAVCVLASVMVANTHCWQPSRLPAHTERTAQPTGLAHLTQICSLVSSGLRCDHKVEFWFVGPVVLNPIPTLWSLWRRRLVIPDISAAMFPAGPWWQNWPVRAKCRRERGGTYGQ